jgi:hypothetical protein
MKNFMLLPAAKSNQINEPNDDDDDDIEVHKETFSDCERGTF